MLKAYFKTILFLMVIIPPLAGFSSPPREVLIRQDSFFGGPYSITDHPYLIRGKVAYTGQDQFQSVFMHYQVDEGEIQTTFFEEINLYPQIPFYYQAEQPWLPDETGVYSIKVWFSGLNGAPDEEAFSDTLRREIHIYEHLPTRQMALLESFSSINCGSCALVAPDLLEIVENNPEQYTMIYYHPLQYEGSPLFAFNPKDQTTRKELYGVNYTPVAAIGSTFFGGSFEVSHELMALEMDKFAGYTMEGSYYILNDILYASVSLEAFADFSENSANTLLIAITEDLVSFNSPPGSNGEKDFHHVMRSFLPDANGSFLTGIQAGDHRQFAFEYDLSAGAIDTSRIRVLAFIQDLEGKEIHQLIRLEFQPQDNTLVNSFEVLEGKVYPNPSSGRMQLSLQTGASPVAMSVHSLDGSLVYRQTFEASTGILNLNLSHLPSGIYLLQAATEKALFRKKISIIR